MILVNLLATSVLNTIIFSMKMIYEHVQVRRAGLLTMLASVNKVVSLTWLLWAMISFRRLALHYIRNYWETVLALLLTISFEIPANTPQPFQQWFAFSKAGEVTQRYVWFYLRERVSHHGQPFNHIMSIYILPFFWGKWNNLQSPDHWVQLTALHGVGLIHIRDGSFWQRF